MTVLRWVFFAWLVVWLVCTSSCAWKFRETKNAYLEEAGNIEWESVEQKHDEQQRHDETKSSTNQLVYRKKTTPSPAGPIVEEEYALTLSELQATSGVVTVSSSASRTVGRADFSKAAGSSSTTAGDWKPSWGGWWLWLVAGVAGLAVAVTIGWPWAKRLRTFLG